MPSTTSDSSASSWRHRMARDACFDDSSEILTSNTDDFIIGDRVWVNGTKPGFIQFIGETQFAPGEWAGVVLDDAVGKNDGSVSGVRYFQCQPKRGIFARLHRLTRRATASNGTSLLGSGRPTTSTPAAKKQGSTSPTSSVKSGVTPAGGRTVTTISNSNPAPRVGDRVIVNATSGIKNGTLRFLGKAEFATGQWAGVELDEPVGKNDGSVAGRRYFTCKLKHGLFAPAHKVLKSNGVTTVRVTRMSTSSTPLQRRSGSHESLNSSLSSASSIARAGRVRLGVTSLTSTQKASRPLGGLTSSTANSALQESLREKEEHIEQLLKERDLERSDVARAAVQVEHAEQELAQVRNEHQKLLEDVESAKTELTQKVEDLELEKNELIVQQEEDKKKIEDLQFRLEEESIVRSDLEGQFEEHKAMILKLQEETGKRGKNEEHVKVPEGSAHEKDDLIFQLQTTLETKKSELGNVQQRLTVTQEELNRTEERHKKQLEVIDDLNLKLSRYESFSNELTEELQNLKSSCSDLQKQQQATEDRCESLSKCNEMVENQLAQISDERSKLEQQLFQLAEEKCTLEQQVEQLSSTISEAEQNAKRLADEKLLADQELTQALDAKAKLELQFTQSVEERSKMLSQEESRFYDEKCKLEQQLKQLIEHKVKLEEQLTTSQDDKCKLEQQLQWATDDKVRLENQLAQTSNDTSGQLSSLNSDLQEKRREMEKFQEELKISNRNKEQLQEEIHSLKNKFNSDLNAANSNLHVAEEQLKSKKLELELLQKEMKTELDNANAHVDKVTCLQNEAALLRNKVDESQREAESQFTHLSSLLECEKTKRDDEINKLAESHTLQVTQLQLEKHTLQEELEHIKKVLVQSTQQTRQLEQENAKFKEEVERLQLKDDNNGVELERLRQEKEIVLQSDKSRADIMENRMQEISKLNEENRKVREMVEKAQREMESHLREMRLAQEENHSKKEEADKMRNQVELHLHEKLVLQDDCKRLKEALEKAKFDLEDERKTWQEQQRRKSSEEQEYSSKIGELEVQVLSLNAEVKRLQEEHSAHREDIMNQMKEASEQNEAMEDLDKQLKLQEDTLEKLQVQLFQSEEDCEKLRDILAASENAKEELLKENQQLITRLSDQSLKKTDDKGNLRKLEEDKVQLENKVVQLQVALQQVKSSINGKDPTLKSLLEEKEAFQGQIEFLNSVIVDMQKKNDELSNKIRTLEEGDSLDLNLNGVKTVIAPRLFCDICDRFDLHDTEDCPTQSTEPEVTHSRHQGKRKEDRPYCASCEIFGHWTQDCDDNETF